MLINSSRVFVFLWSVALIFSGLGSYYGSESLGTTWTALVTTLVGIALLASSNSLAVLQLSVCTYVIAFIAQMPANPNHRWVLFLIALAVLGRVRVIAASGEVAQQIQGSLRWLTIVVYLFATLAKLNTAYFDPEVSCATLFSLQTFVLYGLSGGAGGSSAAALISTVVEGLLPVLLIWRRTRQAAVVLGIVFHIGLSLNIVRYFGNFSAAMFVLLASWLPEETCRRMFTLVAPYSRTVLRVWGLIITGLIVLALTATVSEVEFVIARQVLYLMVAGGLLVVVVVGVYGVRCSDRMGRPSIAIVALALVNASTPYLGLKTRSALTMYSNLRIEPEYSNHLFMPASPDPFGYLKDTVEIIDSTDPRLQERLAKGAAWMPYLSLCAYVACQDDLCASSRAADTITFRRSGVTIKQHKGGPLAPDCPPWIARKILFFGPVGPNSERACTW